METLIDKVDRVLVIQTAFIGDAILTLPMLQKLKQLNPQIEIDVLAIPSTKEIFEASGYVNTVIIIDKKDEHKSLRALNKFIRKLKENNYSKVYSPHRSFRSAYITLRLGVNDSYGFDNSSLKYVYKNLVKYVRTHHEVQRNLELIGENTSDDNWKIKPKINLTEAVKSKVDNIISIKNITEDFIAIAPGSVWATKRYPKESYRGLVESLINKNETVVLIGSKIDRTLCKYITNDLEDKVKNLAGESSIVETICLLKKAKLLVTNDSAPTHLGMCADIPVLTIYCSTIADFGFYPYNDKSKYISYDDLDCKPCGIHGYNKCPIKTFPCGRELTLQNVLIEIEKMLN